MSERAIPDDGHPVVLVTGASSGIGRAIAIELRRRPVHLILVARRIEELRATIEQLPSPTPSRTGPGCSG